MNEENKIHINSFKFYGRDELEDLTKEYYLENQKLKGSLQTYEILLRVNVEENRRLREEIERLKNEFYSLVMSEEEVLEREHLKRKAEER